MLFNSLEFLIFFPLVTFLYFALPHKYRWSLLLAASCGFYMFFKIEYILILFFTIVIDYFAGILLENADSPKKKKQFLTMSLVANIGVLAIFKYYNFINDNISGLASWFGYNNPIPYLNILLPIGLSFHPFQAMSYTFEVYRGNQKAEKHFGIYSLYVMFYPQLVAGPIERPQNIIHQFYEKHSFSYDNVKEGLIQMLWGFFKKVVIADRLAILVTQVYGNVDQYQGTPLIIATVFFTFQVFCDFSGYSDIAIGAARVMGFKLMDNFNRPLSATSISELWRRWHISLSSWINDYLYTPLAIGLRDLGKYGVMLASLISFSIIGLWHGASWNFVIYGFLNGLVLCYEILSKKQRKKISKKIPSFIYNTISNFFTVGFFSFSLIFFRAGSFNDAIYVVNNLFTNLSFRLGGYNMGLEREEFFIAVAGLIVLETAHYLQGRGFNLEKFNRFPVAMRWTCYYLLILVIVMYSTMGSTQFIYFQF